ncbi:succinate dehydrogenase subunit 3 (mitochondrion) [Quercus suber]|uniref:Succinate dehydrogenase subunit 3 n=1 Tax=Quercus suber TaxID=58331 RepID=A0AAW0I3Z4_QUESU
MEKKTCLRPLSPHLPIYKPQLTSTFPISHRISGAFLATIVLFFYLLCLKIGLICFTYKNFYQFFFFSSKLILISVEITALALSYHLFNGVRHLLTDFSGFLFLRIGWEFAKWKLYFRVPETVWLISTCMILALLSFSCVEIAESAGSSSSSGGVGKLPLPSTTSSPVPSISSRGASWIDECFGPEVSSSAPNPEQQQGEEAGPSNQPLPVEAYPYTDTEVIGGDSVSAIQLRLLGKYASPSAAIIEMARLEAQDLFEVKVEIIKLMAQWDQTGDWMGRGARALDNPRTASGEESLEKLSDIWTDLQETGPLSDVFSKLQNQVFQQR